MFSTVIAMLQTRLGEPVARPAAKPLSGEFLSDIEELFSDWIDHARIRLPTAALMTLWAQAACAARDGALGEAQRVALFLTEQLHAYDQRYAEIPAPPGEKQQPRHRPLDPHLRCLTSAAIRWCKRADPRVMPTIPTAAGSRTALAVARWLAFQPIPRTRPTGAARTQLRRN